MSGFLTEPLSKRDLEELISETAQEGNHVLVTHGSPRTRRFTFRILPRDGAMRGGLRTGSVFTYLAAVVR
jgi:hypothetical protein